MPRSTRTATRRADGASRRIAELNAAGLGTLSAIALPPVALALTRAMHIGLNLLYLLPGVVGGTETYAVSLLRGLVGLGGDDRYTVYVNRESASLDFVDSPAVNVVVCDVGASSRSARYAYEQFRLPGQLRRDEVDVLHSLGYVGPLRTPCPHVVTIHDLIYAGFADFMRTTRRVTLQMFVRGTARRADHIITVSTASKRQIVDDIGVDPAKVSVIHHAPRESLRVSSANGDGHRDDTVLKEHGLAPGYILSFSSLSASKNIPRLVDAVASLDDDLDWRLVLVGHVPDDGEVAAAIARHGISDRVVTTGWVADADVPALVRNAAVFVFPSIYEGFGMPALDAQAAGVPLACSNAAALPEVAGDGALYFDPMSTEDIAGALRRLLTDPELRAALVERGRTNVSRYSWEQAARETRDVYRRLATASGEAGNG